MMVSKALPFVLSAQRRERPARLEDAAFWPIASRRAVRTRQVTSLD